MNRAALNRNKPRMLTPEEQEALRQDLRDLMAILKKLREQENAALAQRN